MPLLSQIFSVDRRLVSRSFGCDPHLNVLHISLLTSKLALTLVCSRALCEPKTWFYYRRHRSYYICLLNWMWKGNGDLFDQKKRQWRILEKKVLVLRIQIRISLWICYGFFFNHMLTLTLITNHYFFWNAFGQFCCTISEILIGVVHVCLSHCGQYKRREPTRHSELYLELLIILTSYSINFAVITGEAYYTFAQRLINCQDETYSPLFLSTRILTGIFFVSISHWPNFFHRLNLLTLVVWYCRKPGCSERSEQLGYRLVLIVILAFFVQVLDNVICHNLCLLGHWSRQERCL